MLSQRQPRRKYPSGLWVVATSIGGQPPATRWLTPNPRLEALIDAARRGASVRILLDSFFDDPADLRGNGATVRSTAVS